MKILTPIAANTRKLDLENQKDMHAFFDPLEIDTQSSVVVQIPAGVRNRELNAVPAAKIAAFIEKQFRPKYSEVLARIDDEEVFSDSIETLRELTLEERIHIVSSINREIRESAKDVITFPEEMRTTLAEKGIRFRELIQPQCNSYIEVRDALLPPDPRLALRADMTHFIAPVGSLALQTRLHMAAHDATMRTSETTPLRQIALPYHTGKYHVRESLSLLTAMACKVALGDRFYENMSRGHGQLGHIFKKLQDKKVGRPDQL